MIHWYLPSVNPRRLSGDLSLRGIDAPEAVAQNVRGIAAKGQSVDDQYDSLGDKSLVEDPLEATPRRPRPDLLERPRLMGRVPEGYHCEYGRDLTAADMEALKLPRGTTPRSLVRIHASHHSLARCLAAGMRGAQAALVTGYSPGRISQLENDPAFSALVADYRLESKSVFADMAERMSNLSLDALELIQERLQDTPETFTVPVLLDMVKAFADRTGFGPGQEVHLKVDRDFIDRPPRETAEEWASRRARELEGPTGEAPDSTKPKLN